MSKPLTFEPKWFVVFIFFLVGLFLGSLGLFVWFFNNGMPANLKKIHLQNNSYQFINPLLAVDRPAPKQLFMTNPFESKIQQLIDTKKREGVLLEGAVYFRDLELGEWTGVDEDSKFSPGLILKIPLMMTYLKNAELDPKILDKKFTYRNAQFSDRINDEKDSAGNLTVGQTYTVEQLLEAMIQQDDDGAAEILFDQADKRALKEMYGDLGFDFIEDKSSSDFISVKMYSLLFRVLYGATYLNKDMSEKALQILSDTLGSSLSDSLPKDTVVAHKYRARTYKRNNQELVESHDCGIVYYPDHPYLLCVMGIGKNLNPLNKIFKEISQMVYNNMEQKYQFK